MRWLLVIHALDNFIPFVSRLILKLRKVLHINEIETVIGTAKERRQVILEGLFVRLSKCFRKLLYEALGLLLERIDLIFYDFLRLQLLLNLRVVLAVDEDAFPADLVRVDVYTFAAHQILFPLTFVG